MIFAARSNALTSVNFSASPSYAGATPASGRARSGGLSQACAIGGFSSARRAGKTGLLQLTLTRAVIFSAMTTGTGFRKHVDVELSRHVEHWQANGACSAKHDGLCSALSASSLGRPRQLRIYSEQDANLREAAE